MGKQDEIEKSGERSKVIVASRSPGFLNFPMSSSDEIGHRYSVVAKEGRDIGAVTHVEVTVAAESSSDPMPFQLPKQQQRLLAINVCQRLTRAYGGGPSDKCDDENMGDVVSDFSIKGIASQDVSAAAAPRSSARAHVE